MTGNQNRRHSHQRQTTTGVHVTGNPKGNNPLTMMLKDVITAMYSMSIDLRMMNQYVAMDTITDHIQKTPAMNNLKD